MAGIYIHIPFCVKKCAYCDFVSLEGDTSQKQRYLAALLREIELSGKEYSDRAFDTVFIGGGTPSTLPDEAVSEILAAIRQHFRLADNPEISIEVNPNTASLDKLIEYKAAGANRISIGLQSANDNLLKKIGRIHSFADFQETLTQAKQAGFTDINVDIMYGLPNQTVDDYLETIRLVANAEVPHVSAYSLILEEGTRLFDAVNKHEITLPDKEAEFEMHTVGKEYLLKLGYQRYEISNYAKNGHECRHNLKYWDMGDYIGVGLNAHSAIRAGDKLIRYYNTSDLDKYYSLIESNMLPIEHKEAVPTQEEMFEFFMLGLRKTSGVKAADFQNRFGVSPFEIFNDAINKNAKKGFLCYDNSSIWLTDTGLDMQNQVLTDFMIYVEE